jgi:hypothetical protein
MSKAVATRNNHASIEKVLIQGDLTPMTEADRLAYVKAVCKAIGVSILFRPFDYIKLNNKLVLYANRACTEQLRILHNISIKITARERIDGLYVVTAYAKTRKNKEDESIGAVNIKGLSGEALANAMMKAETKAKRRVTLSIAGLGMLDEIEAKQIAEKEQKIATELAVEETTAKLDATTSRPEFETEREAPSIEQPAPESAAPKEYTLRTVKGAKGKVLKAVSSKILKNWLSYYDEMAKKGDPIHAEVQDDAFHIRAFLDEAQHA